MLERIKKNHNNKIKTMKSSHVDLWGKSKDKMLNLHCNATATSYSATLMHLICVERERERERTTKTFNHTLNSDRMS